MVGGGGEHTRLFDPALARSVELANVLGGGTDPGGNLREFVLALEEFVEDPEVALLINERFDGVDAAGAVV